MKNFLDRIYILLFVICIGQFIILPLYGYELTEIFAHKESIALTKERWRLKVALLKQQDPATYADFEQVLKTGYLSKIKDVISGVYILYDAEDQPKYIVKPSDERIFCVNNELTIEKNYSLTSVMRSYVPNYEGVQREALTYLMANFMGVDYLVPKTIIAIIENEAFFDIMEHLPSAEGLNQHSYIDKEKLCSVQVFIPEAEMLFDRTSDWMEKDYSIDNILKEIDPVSFENLMILIWTMQDTDVHGGNILFQHSTRLHDPIYKIDHDLSFPSANGEMVNCLASLPQADYYLSTRAQEKIKEIPIQTIVSWMHFFELGAAVQAFLERVEVLQVLASREYTLLEIDLRIRLLGLPEGKDLALKDWTTDELFDFLEELESSDSFTTTSFPFKQFLPS